MTDYDLKVHALYEMQGHRCAITGRALVPGQKWDLHHAGVADSKRKFVLTRYRELLHSLLNLELVDNGDHITQPVPHHWPMHIADKLERRLRADRALADLMNCRRIPLGVTYADIADTKEYLLREAGAIDTSRQDHIVELMLAKRGAVA